MESYYYNVEIDWTNRRKGIICSPELNRKNGVCIEVATTPELPTGVEGIWSPEHLFVASVSGCLMTTFLAIAENSSLEFVSFNCGARGRMDKVEDKIMMSVILLSPTVVIHSESQVSKAKRILKKAEDACLISHSIKSKVIMDITIEVKPLGLIS